MAATAHNKAACFHAWLAPPTRRNFPRRDLDQLLRAPRRPAVDVKMVSHQQQERLATGELPRAEHRVP